MQDCRYISRTLLRATRFAGSVPGRAEVRWVAERNRSSLATHLQKLNFVCSPTKIEMA